MSFKKNRRNELNLIILRTFFKSAWKFTRLTRFVQILIDIDLKVSAINEVLPSHVGVYKLSCRFFPDFSQIHMIFIQFDDVDKLSSLMFFEMKNLLASTVLTYTVADQKKVFLFSLIML